VFCRHQGLDDPAPVATGTVPAGGPDDIRCDHDHRRFAVADNGMEAGHRAQSDFAGQCGSFPDLWLPVQHHDHAGRGNQLHLAVPVHQPDLGDHHRHCYFW